ncbi:MAG: BlaI/MecI/CopY family transcriptional regulator [Deltaproteobacteria bacterium]
MKTMSQISEAELEVIKILWELNEATSSQIVDRLTQTTDWKPKTVQTLITRLVAKKAIKAEKINNKAFIYSPNVSEEEYKAYANSSFLKRVYNGSVNLMLTSFIKERKLSSNEIEELKKLLDGKGE